MYQYQFFRKFLLGGRSTAGAICGSVPISSAVCQQKDGSCGISKAMESASKTEKTDSCKRCQSPMKVRPSELPIYGCDDTSTKKEEKKEEPSSLEEMIGAARKELWSFYDQYKDLEKKAMHVVETGKAHSSSAITYLQEDATTIHRAGAIGVGGLAGFIMGLRGGWFKRLLYGTTGAVAMAALCYPKESAEAGDEGLQLAKYYFTVVYNFIYGVKPEGFNFLGATIGVPDKNDLPEREQEESEQPQQLIRDQSNPADKDLYTTRS